MKEGKQMRKWRAAYQKARFRTVAPLVHFIAKGDEFGSMTVQTVVESGFAILEKPARRVLGGQLLDVDAVERRYDSFAGKYGSRTFGSQSEEMSLCVVDGKRVKVSRGELASRRYDEYADILSRLSFQSLLEVGAGELVTTAGIAMRFSDVKCAAVELSFPSVLLGKQFYESSLGADVLACKASALALPFGDASIDLVVTSGCLTLMGDGLESAVRECLRVCRKAAVFFEPSFELGDHVQKLRMLAHGYHRNLYRVMREIAEIGGVRIHEPWLLKNGTVYNRFGCFLLERMPMLQEIGCELGFVCPACRGALSVHHCALDCVACGLAFPVVHGVPVLEVQRALVLPRAPAARTR